MPNDRDPASQGWHLDRRIPITLLAAILLQAMAFAWAASAAFSQIGDNSRRIEALEVSRAADRAVQAQISERLARIEQRQDEVSRGIGEVKALLDRLIWERGDGDGRRLDWPPTQR